MDNTTTQRAALMRDANFRWLLGGGAISMLGDQLSLIALPWLVLKMTGDALATGWAIALTGIPRAVFILIGGALVDRHSPKRVLLLSKYVNIVLLGLLAFAVLGNHLSLPAVYALALGIGLASAFSIPSATALTPHVIAPDQLQTANGVMMGMRQLTLLAGPLLAGFLIAHGGSGADGVADSRGLGLAFALDCASFAVSAWTLAKVRTHAIDDAPADPAILGAIRDALTMVWRARDMRTAFGYWTLVVFCTSGAIQVALPVMANARLGGAATLGLLLGAHGAGTLLGMAASGILGRRRLGSLGATILAIDAIVGVLVMPLGLVTAAWQGAALLLAVGALGGFMQVTVFTWLQRRVPRPMLGRTMSIFMFIFMGVAPLSALVAGWLLQYASLSLLFAGSGGLLLGVAALAFLFTPMRHMSDVPAAATAE